MRYYAGGPRAGSKAAERGDAYDLIVIVLYFIFA